MDAAKFKDLGGDKDAGATAIAKQYTVATVLCLMAYAP